jgi:hypothetical protein
MLDHVCTRTAIGASSYNGFSMAVKQGINSF